MKKKSNEYDYIIVGGGPSGLQMAYFLEQNSDTNYIVLEKNDTVGSFFTEYPRHKKLISINKVWNGYDDPEINLRWDWNSLINRTDQPLLFKEYSKKYFPSSDDLVAYLQDFKTKYNLNVKLNSEVKVITKKEELFKVTLANGQTIQSKYLLVGTGLSLPYIPDIAGIETTENYNDVSINPDDFINQDVLIIGKGNSAFETADCLIDTAALIHISSPERLKMAWSTKFVGNVRAVNNNFMDTYQLKSRNAILDADIKDIKKLENGKYEVEIVYPNTAFERVIRHYDRVICCTGFRTDNSIFDKAIEPTLCNNKKLPVQQCNWESSNVSNMYFLGTLMQYLDYKKSMSGFIHGFRYNIECLYNILMYENHNIPIPTESYDLEHNLLSNMILDKANTASDLWQQPSFLGNAIRIDRKNNKALFFKTMPVNYIKERLFDNDQDEYLILTLEFSPKKLIWPFDIVRPHPHDTAQAHTSPAIHPIIRRFIGSNIVSTHHVIEDLDGEWKMSNHTIPLLEYMKNTVVTPLEGELSAF